MRQEGKLRTTKNINEDKFSSQVEIRRTPLSSQSKTSEMKTRKTECFENLGNKI